MTHTVVLLEQAVRIAAHYGVRHEVVDVSGLGQVLAGSALTDPTVAVPHGHYAAESMRATIVPNRNAIMAAITAGVAYAWHADAITLGVHAGDHPIYPDCRPAFIERLTDLLAVATEPPLAVRAPFLHSAKSSIAARGAQLGAPLHLTWSCYEGGDLHCGRCGTCWERAEAFADAGVPDPTRYADPDYYRAVSPV
jgi:7-cyano-7-deazaguanine synthase